MSMEIKYDVFISYSSKDCLDKNGKEIPGNIISVIKKLFERNGLKYWIDQKENLTGKLLTHVFCGLSVSCLLPLIMEKQLSRLSNAYTLRWKHRIYRKWSS